LTQLLNVASDSGRPIMSRNANSNFTASYSQLIRSKNFCHRTEQLTVIKSTWSQLLAYLLTCVTYEERFDLFGSHHVVLMWFCGYKDIDS